MHPKHLSIDDFTYELPAEKIALYPANPRDQSRLLVFEHGNISEDIYRNIDAHLPANSILVFNDTKVIKSRIFFPKATGSVIEIFCLEPVVHTSDFELSFQQTGETYWKCMIGKAGKWKEKTLSKMIMINGCQVELRAAITEKLPDGFVVCFSWFPGNYSFGEVINAAGVTPLPPYIKREANKADEQTYQTVFSSHEGSVAAPTAGLHFTEALIEKIRQKGIITLFTTLHVGAGTFKPVKSSTMEGHQMHAEWMNISVEFLDALLKNADKKIISVGTTATRTLESIYWMGNKILNRQISDADELKISQWEVYEQQNKNGISEAISALKEWIKSRNQLHLLIDTEIIIAPGYSFQIVKGLITNFHQPKSTLLLLVAALAGEEWKSIYEYAIKNNFRFLSYGDGCLIL